MFALPEAKRVRREDLNGSDASSTSGDEDDLKAREELEAQIARSLGIDIAPPAPAHGQSRPAQSKPAQLQGGEDEASEDEEMEEAPEEYDFCLFGGSAAPTTTKVILEHDEELKGDGAILSNRPSSYYLARQYTPQEKEQFASAAVTAEQILSSSTRRQWSNEMPWKVTHITCHVSGQTPPDDTPEGKRRRPGKKRRLAIRVMERKRKDKDEEKKRKKEEAKVKEVEKEEHLKEKKKRLNRARKLKRREKAREERRARGEAVDDDEDAGSSEGE